MYLFEFTWANLQIQVLINLIVFLKTETADSDGIFKSLVDWIQKLDEGARKIDVA